MARVVRLAIAKPCLLEGFIEHIIADCRFPGCIQNPPPTEVIASSTSALVPLRAIITMMPSMRRKDDLPDRGFGLLVLPAEINVRCSALAC